MMIKLEMIEDRDGDDDRDGGGDGATDKSSMPSTP